MSVVLIPLLIAAGFLAPLSTLLYLTYRNRTRVISTTEVPDLGVVREYAGRLEGDLTGPWGTCTLCDFEKRSSEFMRTASKLFSAKYETLFHQIDTAVKEAFVAAECNPTEWNLSNITLGESEGEYSLIIDVPESPRIRWGIGVEIQDLHVVEWELIH